MGWAAAGVGGVGSGRCGRGTAAGVGGAGQEVWEGHSSRCGRGRAGMGGARQQEAWEGHGSRCGRGRARGVRGPSSTHLPAVYIVYTSKSEYGSEDIPHTALPPPLPCVFLCRSKGRSCQVSN